MVCVYLSSGKSASSSPCNLSRAANVGMRKTARRVMTDQRLRQTALYARRYFCFGEEAFVEGREARFSMLGGRSAIDAKDVVTKM